MAEPLDILTILETAAAEIRSLREAREFNRLTMHNIAIRQAVHQLRHGPVDYKNCPAEDWNTLLALAEAGRLVLTLSADVWVSGESGGIRELTPEVFAAIKAAKA